MPHEELDVQALRIGPAQLRIERAPDRDGGLRLEVIPVDSWHGEPRNAAEDEHDGLRWAGIDELPGLVLAHDGRRSTTGRAGPPRAVPLILGSAARGPGGTT